MMFMILNSTNKETTVLRMGATATTTGGGSISITIGRPDYSSFSTCTTSFLHPPLSLKLNFHIHLLPSEELLLRRWRRWSVPLTWGPIKGRRTSNDNRTTSSWDDKPYYDEQPFLRGNRAYLEEQDIVTFLRPPKQLIPLDPSSYNPAAYLWKKIGDIPEERRPRLLSLLKPSLISRAWEIAGTKYEDPKLAKKSASSLLYDGDDAKSLEFWNCRKSAGTVPIAWINYFKKVTSQLLQAVFRCKDGRTYGRFIGGSVFTGVSNYFPLYFVVKQLNKVMATEQPCDLTYEFGDGLFDLYDYPHGFPKPAKHPWPFNDQVFVYIRHIGPGVLVGQAWQEGEALEQVPKKLCGEILMVKDYEAAS